VKDKDKNDVQIGTSSGAWLLMGFVVIGLSPNWGGWFVGVLMVLIGLCQNLFFETKN